LNYFYFMQQTFGVLVLVCGLLAGIAFFVAGFQLGVASAQMSELRSVGGTSVAEAYYQESGKQGMAYSIALFACGLAVFSISFGFGGTLLTGSSLSPLTPQIPDHGESEGPPSILG